MNDPKNNAAEIGLAIATLARTQYQTGTDTGDARRALCLILDNLAKEQSL